MIIVCPKCSTRLQVDDEKSPNRPFNVRCPKCSATVSSGPSSPATEQSALAVGGSPSTDHPRFEPTTARAYEPSTPGAPGVTSATPANDDTVRMLFDMLSKSTNPSSENPNARPSWDKRKALVCTSEPYRELVASKLSEVGCQVFVAEETRQAVETMRANKMDVVVLEPQFDPAEQGSVFVMREINVLRPPQRRRLFFVLLSPSLRTMDAHAAFLNNVNAIVNVTDIEELSRIMEVGLREYNELYREFYTSFGLTAL
ncbi:MAG TPA: zinc-ribbon domain-containing protein [Pyrinomonadaceae bacterium]|nr:zinc-ribbon domain-containing protein [Pyrinomonadaceae bacterium]